MLKLPTPKTQQAHLQGRIHEASVANITESAQARGGRLLAGGRERGREGGREGGRDGGIIWGATVHMYCVLAKQDSVSLLTWRPPWQSQ